MVPNRADSVGSLIAAVKSWQPCPDALKVFLMDGTERMVTVTKRRQKWSHLRRTFEQLNWAQVEGLNAQGHMVGVYENPDVEPGEMEELEGVERNVEVAGLLSMMLKAQDVALRRQGDYHGRMMDQLVKVVEVLSDRLVKSERVAGELQDIIAAMKTSGGGEGTEAEAALMAALPHLLQAAAPARVPPNGDPTKGVKQ